MASNTKILTVPCTVPVSTTSRALTPASSWVVYLRAKVAVDTNSVYTGDTSSFGGAHNRFSNAYTWRSRQDLTLDTHTATEYGVVRTFFDATFRGCPVRC